ncbi:MurR/RpiR family transcriptional regulator [Lacticaseibacillus zhaodongensis]|uniref:MurR/RpiR family transcriptional regulator n=1 Tax=Lacticaseibacillus zhaodongensis TaxID=2668065 RepID=UPI0012D2B7F9|nr:MurR/RpiR family transcriptional regulator [Lacticaseibacillus zhaodongensis]
MLLTDQLKTANNLTATEERLRDYILKHLDDVPTITIQQLAAASYTSHSAVVRFTKKLGFTGFRDFRNQLSKEAQRQALTVQEVNANFPFTPGDSPLTIAKKMADLTTTAVAHAFAQLNEQELGAAANILTKADRIYLFADGDSQIRARSFQSKLVKVARVAVIAEEYNDGAWNAAAIRPTDCAVFLSYGGNSSKHIQYLQLLHKHQVPTLVITGNAQSAQLAWADASLVASQDENDTAVKVSTFSSQATFEYLLDVLFNIMYARDYQRNLVHLKTNYETVAKINEQG